MLSKVGLHGSLKRHLESHWTRQLMEMKSVKNMSVVLWKRRAPACFLFTQLDVTSRIGLDFLSSHHSWQSRQHGGLVAMSLNVFTVASLFGHTAMSRKMQLESSFFDCQSCLKLLISVNIFSHQRNNESTDDFKISSLCVCVCFLMRKLFYSKGVCGRGGVHPGLVANQSSDL